MAAGAPQGASTQPQASSQGETPKLLGVSGALGHRQAVCLRFKGLGKYLEKHGDISKFALRIDGIKVMEGARLIGDEELRFDFAQGKVSKDTWARLSNCIQAKDSFYAPRFKIAVGYAQEPLIKGGQEYPLTYINEGKFWLFIGLYAALVVIIFCLGIFTGLLRDPCPEVESIREKPYSLGKAQMAFWFLVVLPCFFYIWLITGSTESLTKQTLILLGISSLTTLVAGYVDKTKDAKQNAEITAQENKLREAGEQLMVAPTAEAQAKLKAVIEEASDQLGKIKAQTPPLDTQASQGFIKDILRDSYSISIHRFQCVVWTAILGVIFLYNTFCDLAMPEFSATLLTLLGISNGTYVALKVPEK